MSAPISVRDVVKTFSSQPPAAALRGIDLEISAGSFTAVLGASGCGKTTLLRVIAGLERPDSGVVAIGDATVASNDKWVPPESRHVGIVPQDAALFPHMDVAANIGFGLNRAERKTSRVDDLLHLVGMAGLGKRMPWELSGGQQQRVALARALAPDPKVVLLDEPFGALDASLRESIRADVRSVLSALGTTSILVTHDQEEALSMADQVAIMRSGRIVQKGAPDDVYRSPVDIETAMFLGTAMVLGATFSDGKALTSIGTLSIDKRDTSDRGVVVIRPEQLRIHADDEGVVARVVDRQYFGHDGLIRLVVEDGESKIELMARHLGARLPMVGEIVGITVDGDVIAFPEP